MHPAYVGVDAATLQHMYVDQRMTTEQIASRVGCTGTTIRRRLRAFAIPMRPRGPRTRPDGRCELSPWTPSLAYVVGVIATDGNLSKDGRHLTIPSKDRSLLDSVRACLGLRNSITEQRNARGHSIFRLQWGDRIFYDWLRRIGLTPAKSLTLGPLAVPDDYFPDFFRGCLDGDGTVLRYIDRYHAARNERYVYERLYVNLVSASHAFLDWIQATLTRLLDVRGAISVTRKPAARPCYVLRYAKREAPRVLRWIYYASDVPCLGRKRDKAAPFLSA